MDRLETSAFGDNIRRWIELGIFDGVEGVEKDKFGKATFEGVLKWINREMLEGGDGVTLTYTPGIEAGEPDAGEVTKAAADGAQKIADAIADQEPEEIESDTTVTQHVIPETDVQPPEDAQGTVDEAIAETQAELTDAGTGKAIIIQQAAQVDLTVTATITGTDFENAGTAAATAFATGIASGQSESDAAASRMATMAAVQLSDGIDKARGLGVDFAHGYAEGISSGSNAAINAAIRMAKAALSAVQSTQDSASPSKITMGLGENFGEGYEIGIRNSMANAIDTARAMTGEVLNASVIGSNGMGVIRVEAGSEPLQVEMESASKPVYLDGVQIADIQGSNTQAQLAFMDDRQKRGVGR